MDFGIAIPVLIYDIHTVFYPLFRAFRECLFPRLYSRGEIVHYATGSTVRIVEVAGHADL